MSSAMRIRCAILLGMADVQAAPQTPDPGRYGPDGRSEWLDIDWREHQQWVWVAGRPVNVIDIGEGDPIVFIHGLSGAWVNWLENIPHFARDHRVIAMDLPGFGDSPMPAEKISIAGYGRIVDELLDALGIDRAVIVGNSMGGFIAAEIAIQFGTRVENLVLISAAGISIEHQRNEPVLHVLERLDDVLILGTGWMATRSAMLAGRPRARRQIMKLVAHRADALPAPLIAEQVKGSGKPGFVPALDALTDYPIRDRLGKIECPVLVVWGAEDRLVPVRDAYTFGELIPNARVVVWPDTGHVAMLERPGAFNALVDDFLAE
jgi:4,5:9,10-diseco-3-hydroxy-5,9,17-trioxoandrosta-1(10),2-diene-4-oate hydrolase